jgi:hypothetical protein
MESEMRSAICAIALLVGIATATPAKADDDPDAMALGVGAELGGCGDWLKERPGSPVDIAVRQWILGFFSGVNVAGDLLGPGDIKVAIHKLSNLNEARMWCRTHPSQPIGSAAETVLIRAMDAAAQPPATSSVPRPQLIPPDTLVPTRRR